ncbi:MAG: DUF5694 domain-containing protein [Pseudomonadota bacterium]
MRILKTLVWIAGVLAVIGGGIAAWLFIPWPAPAIESRITTGYDPGVYDGSMPADSGSPEIMIVGSTHLAQNDPYGADALDQVAGSLAAYQPDMVVVEYLPPDYPDGAGRDYRPEFDLTTIPGMDSLDRETADELIRRAQQGESVPACRLSKAYLRIRDLMNALYLWQPGHCPGLAEHEELADWAERQRTHEAARFGFHAARQAGLDGVVSFDYQGADARWFIHSRLQQAIQNKDISEFWALWPMMPLAGAIPRAFDSHKRPHTDNIINYLNYYNSPEHIGLQYWVYEEAMQEIRLDDIGSRQTKNYWTRNERMFDNLHEAAQTRKADRIMVIVGGGHKYFLDELARDAGYRWIDPREYLPSPDGEF